MNSGMSRARRPAVVRQRLLRFVIAVLSAALITAGVGVSPARASTGCTGFGLQACVNVNGSGTWVNNAQASGYTMDGGDFYLELWGNGFYYNNWPGGSYLRGARFSFTRTINRNLPNGSGVCAALTRFNGPRVSVACVTIRA